MISSYFIKNIYICATQLRDEIIFYKFNYTLDIQEKRSSDTLYKLNKIYLPFTSYISRVYDYI